MIVTYVNQHLERLLELRCCCQPVKLYGYLPYPLNEEPAAGQRIMFPVRPVADPNHGPLERLVLPIATVEGSRVAFARPAPMTSAPRVLLEHDAHLAYKSEETPIEVVRRVPGFLEAPVRMLRVPLQGEVVAICFARRSLEEWGRQIRRLGERLGVYVCAGCGLVSANPHDMAEGYCGNCHLFDEAVG